ncbi:MAG: ribosome recycling factor [Chloroflexi bacterium]|nr:MAG: ribosome recycling factor [Chloroflexota bacterium]
MIDDWLKDAEIRMEKSLEALHKELQSIRTGRATPALIDRLQVDYYGAATPLQSLASITAPEARLLVIQPYDRGAITAIEKAIQKSELGLNPGNDGQLIRIPVPALTEERRKEFVKLVKRHAEEARVAIRNIRRDEVDHVKRMEKDGEAGTDEIDRGLAAIQKVTDRFIARVEEIAHRKEADILEV